MRDDRFESQKEQRVFLALWSTGYARGVGGSEQVVNALLRGFPPERFQTLLITNGDPGQSVSNPFFPDLPAGVAVHVDTFPNPLLSRGPVAFAVSLFKYLQATLRLLLLFRRRSPDVVHLHLVSLDVFLLALFKKIFGYRLAVTFCGGDLTVTRTSALARLKVRTALRYADATTTVSEEMADRLRREFRARSVVCIPNGVNHAEVGESVLAMPAVHADHFVYVGRLHPDKRVPLLVEIFKKSIDVGCDRNLYIVGDGSDREQVAEVIAKYGLSARVFMLGAMSHSQALSVLARSRCLLLVSREEGCPNVVLEAMALAVPVIATQVGGVPDLIAHGDTGYLVPVDDPYATAEYVERLALNPAEAASMGRRAAEMSRRQFDLSNTVGTYVGLYRSLFPDVEPTASTHVTAWPGIRSQ